jgi:hypothetical protein
LLSDGLRDLDVRSSPDRPLGDAIETFIRPEDAGRFVEEVRGDDSDGAGYLRKKDAKREAG